MNEMIERVARVLEPQAWAALGIGDTLAYSNRRTSSLRKARLVFKEIRVPTDAMTKAAIPELLYDDQQDCIGAAYTAMIDAALATTPPTAGFNI